MSTRNTVTTMAAVKLGIFSVISVLVTGLLAVIMGHFNVGSEREYKAIFTSASELKSGDDVRVAGVSVGSVSSVDIYHRSQALVTFSVSSDLPMTTASGAEIRFLNLVGDRYLAVTEGTPGAPPLSTGATIPSNQTTPALNLTELFNGFQPLFQALTPKDVNDLSMNLVKVLQGEGGDIQDLLAKTASLTNTLANRDQLIGDVVTNLTGTLQTLDEHHQQLSDVITGFRQWMGQLAADRNQIGDSLQNISTLTKQVADLVTQARPFTKDDIAQLRRVMEILNKPANQAALAETLKALPGTLISQARIGSFGSWYNYYLCDFTGQVTLPQLGTLLNLGPAAAQANGAIAQIQDQINKYLSVYSTADRCAS